jgi:hypothetical protein
MQRVPKAWVPSVARRDRGPCLRSVRRGSDSSRRRETSLRTHEAKKAAPGGGAASVHPKRLVTRGMPQRREAKVGPRRKCYGTNIICRLCDGHCENEGVAFHSSACRVTPSADLPTGLLALSVFSNQGRAMGERVEDILHASWILAEAGSRVARPRGAVPRHRTSPNSHATSVLV